MSGGITLPNAVGLSGSTSPVVFTGNPITFTGAVTQSNTPLLLVNNTTTFTGASLETSR